MLRDRRTFGKSQFPFRGEHRRGEPEIVYDKAETPGAVEALQGVVVLPLNEKYTREHVEYVGDAIARTAKDLVG